MGDGGGHDPEAATDTQTALRGLQPQCWPSWRKWVYIVLAAYCECLTFLVSMMLAPSVPQVMQEFRPDGGAKSLGSFCVTVYILGFCVGPLLLAPLTDLYGRTVIYRVYVLLFLLATLGCALAPSLEALITFRFFAGCFGGAPMAIGGAVITDMFPPGTRSGPMAFYSVGTMMGPTLGPVLGGLITGSLNWRWVFWIAAILSGVAAIGLFFILPETHLPTLLRRQTRKELSDSTLSPAWRPPNCNRQSLAHSLSRAVSLPARIAFFHLPIFSILLLGGVFNGLVNMILSSLGSIYQIRYHFSPTTAGLSYPGIGLGGLTALAVAKRLIRFIANKAGIPEANRPEYALPFLMLVGPVTTAGLVWYGWSLQGKVFWIVPIIGLFFFGFGYMSTRLSLQLFLVEAVPDFSASALAAFTVASSVGGAILPLATFPLYDGIGDGWGNTIIAVVNLALCVIPLSMYIVARKLGESWKIQVTLLHE